jgi:hypothetical protein
MNLYPFPTAVEAATPLHHHHHHHVRIYFPSGLSQLAALL